MDRAEVKRYGEVYAIETRGAALSRIESRRSAHLHCGRDQQSTPAFAGFSTHWSDAVLPHLLLVAAIRPPYTDQKLPATMFFGTKRLSCGIVVLTEDRELLLCHVTGQNHWDLPKGGIDIGEFPIDAALRETREETGLQLDAGALLEIGRLHYTVKKDLHLFAARSVRLPLSSMHCDTFYVDRYSRRLLPEMDGYGWFDFARVPSLCTPKMAELLSRHVDPEALLRALAPAPTLLDS